jgi:CDP-paratose 2-epimerase
MRVFVSGGCGFIGSHVCEFYARRGDSVVSYDNMTKYELFRTGYATEEARNSNWKYLEGLGVQLVKADIRNYEDVMQYASGADFIVHTAAQPAMTISVEDPELDLTTNVVGTFNLLKAARSLKIPIVSCCSVHVYGNKINETVTEEAKRYTRTPPQIDESYPVVQGLLTPLHASKRAAELYVQTFIDSYKVTAASFRLTGLYGPRQFGGEDHGWVANFCIRALTGKPLRIFGTGKQIRDILYADDVVRAFHAFYESGKPGVYNIGGGMDCATSLLECVDIIEEMLGARPELRFEEVRQGDLYYFICDTQKARKELKWSPTVFPRQGIRKLIDWIAQERHLFSVT